MFEKASRMRLRIPTSKGNAAVEDLWDLSLLLLNDTAKKLNKKIKVSGEEDFLDESIGVDPIIQLQFDLVRHVMKIKQLEATTHANAARKKAELEEWIDLLDEKEKEDRKGFSIDDIRKKISELNA